MAKFRRVIRVTKIIDKARAEAKLALTLPSVRLLREAKSICLFTEIGLRAYSKADFMLKICLKIQHFQTKYRVFLKVKCYTYVEGAYL